MDFKIRDLRKKEQFTIDDAYLNGYARLCGINATGVYLSLCRHANYQTQTCFPSKRLIAEELDISEKTVYTALKTLEQWNIIKSVNQGRKQDGSFKNNTYYLLDKSEWKPKPQLVDNQPSVNVTDGKKQPSPQVNKGVSRRYVVPNKDSNNTKDSNKKESSVKLYLGSESTEELIRNFTPRYEKLS